MKLSKREKRLIYLLVIIALIAGIMLLYQKTSSTITELEETSASLDGEMMQMQNAINNLESLKQSVPELYEQAKSDMGKFYKVKKNRELDSIITELALENDLTPLSLIIVPPHAVTLEPYSLYSEAEGSETEADFSNIFSAQLTFTGRGTKQNLYSFLDNISQNSGMRVNSLNFTLSGTSVEFSLTASVYMSAITEEMIHENGQAQQ